MLTDFLPKRLCIDHFINHAVLDLNDHNAAQNSYLHRRKNAEALPELNLDAPAVMRELGEASVDRLGRAYGIYRATVKALLAEDYSALKRLRKKARELNRTLEAVQDKLRARHCKGSF